MENTQIDPAHLTVETRYGKAQVRVINQEKVMFFFFPDGSDYALVNRVEHRARIEYIKGEHCWQRKHQEIYCRDKTGSFHKYPSDSAIDKICTVADAMVNNTLSTPAGKEALKIGEKIFQNKIIKNLVQEKKQAYEKMVELDKRISAIREHLAKLDKE